MIIIHFISIGFHRFIAILLHMCQQNLLKSFLNISRLKLRHKYCACSLHLSNNSCQENTFANFTRKKKKNKRSEKSEGGAARLAIKSICDTVCNKKKVKKGDKH